MSGHSKWATIKRAKGATDAKKSATFTKLGNFITIAARDGGGDSSTNFKLRLSVDKARAANMPKENIERAVKRGTGELAGAAFEEHRYELRGPSGTAFIVDVMTDNKNRAVANMKGALNKHNAKLVDSGSVNYLFEPRGHMLVNKIDESTEMNIIESGAADYTENEDGTFTVFTSPQETFKVAKALQEQGLTVNDIELILDPKESVIIADEKVAEQLISLSEELESQDDVRAVYSNFDISE